ncbi:hypothetical protein GCM10017706_26180 [Lactococcus lactis subsp. hordniae]
MKFLKEFKKMKVEFNEAEKANKLEKKSTTANLNSYKRNRKNKLIELLKGFNSFEINSNWTDVIISVFFYI